MSDRIINAQDRNSFSLKFNKFSSVGLISGVERRSLPTNAFWETSFNATDLDSEGDADTASLDEIEAEAHAIQMESLFFTMYDTWRREPRGTPLADITQGECLDFISGQEFTDDSYQIAPVGSRASVYQPARMGAFSVSIQGLLPDTLVLCKGDKFSIHHGPLRIPMLYQVTQDISSDENGRCSVKIVPGLRMDVASNDPISFYRPRSVFQLIEVESSRTAPMFGRSFFLAREAPYVVFLPNLTF